VKVKL